ncbi:hypothetical protein MMC07_009220 [Pseudocyphellaria aurata]|nr:hypothetical protein [Pseudocyphellaria aurata]
MSAGLPSDEVAEDYKNSLEDLTMNSKYEISNLTVIAKENTEHGMAISRVLENHIRNTPPDRKLPALYVLDSIVKNVGTPYTLFLGRNLYQTFMDAYSLVQSQIRKKLDEMLKTWKEPVPGSLDPRPVFPVETTRPIENALIKARTHAIQQQQQQQRSQQQDFMNRGRPPATPPVPSSWRNTPTPPQINGRYPPPPTPTYTQPNAPNGHVPTRPFPSYPPYQPPSTYPQNFPQPPGFQQPPTENLESLHKDIADLITAARQDFAAKYWDSTIQGQLKALLDLQIILRNHQLPPDQIQQVRDQVTQLSASRRQAAITSTPAPVPPTPTAPPPVSNQPPDLQSLMSTDTLARILNAANLPMQQAQPPPPTPPLPQNPPHPIQPPSSHPSVNPTSAFAVDPGLLMEGLRAAGIIQHDSSTPLKGTSQPPQPVFPYPQPPTMPNPLPTLPVKPAAIESQNGLELSSASLKIHRSHLILNLYGARPNQCSTCGRRFFLTAEGKEKKARHLDWHFRTNQRLADSAKRGQSRSWYVDELEWIKYRDSGDEGIERSANGIEAAKALAAATAAANDPKNKYIPVPDDSSLADTPCPICQEKFETSWNEDAQDFVWMDAVKIGARVYHASCHSEVKKQGGNTPLRTVTPDSVLGKRRAGMSDINPLPSKIRA